MKQVLLLALPFSVFIATAQSVAIKKIELAGGQIVVHYDLEDSNPANEYQLNLYASRDNYVSALAKVAGDIGSEVKPGAGKQVRWNVREEWGGYQGRVSLEIRGKVYLPFVKLQQFDANKTYRRGRSYNLQWKSGSTNPIHIEVYQGGRRIAGEMNQPNNGAHTFFLPARTPKGDDYRIKISDSKQPENVIFTPDFTVKPKVPFLLKALPVAAAVGALVFLLPELTRNGRGAGGVAPTDENLPLPPLPSGN
jgi:hypothetical protein